MNTKQIKSLVAKIEKAKDKIASQRDIIRELHAELENLLETLDEGVNSIEIGCLDISAGIDELSQKL